MRRLRAIWPCMPRSAATASAMVQSVFVMNLNKPAMLVQSQWTPLSGGSEEFTLISLREAQRLFKSEC